MASSDPKRRTTVERVTDAVNRSLDQLGCSYCRKYKPADQVRRRRTRLGIIKSICNECAANRKPPIQPQPKT